MNIALEIGDSRDYFKTHVRDLLQNKEGPSFFWRRAGSAAASEELGAETNADPQGELYKMCRESGEEGWIT